MQLTRQAASAAATAGSVNKWPWVGLAVLLLLIVSVLMGMWAGQRWQKGTEATEENNELRTDIEQLQAAIKDLREYDADVTLAYDQAAQRLDNTANEREQDRETNRKNMAQLRNDLERLLQERPDLRDSHAGDDVLRHWNKSNSRPAAAPTTPEHTDESSPGVPGPTSGAIGPLERSAGQPRRSNVAVSRLPEQQQQAYFSGGNLGGNRLGVVLHRTGTDRHQSRRLPAQTAQL